MNKKTIPFPFICFFVLLQSLHPQPDPAFFTSDSLLIITPFRDNSGFNGKWNLPIDVPRFFTAYNKERFRVGIISPLSVKQFMVDNNIDTTRFNNDADLKRIAEYFRARYIITAEITEFSIGRFMVSEVQLAGYEAFSATVKVNVVVYDAALFTSSREAVLYEGEAEGTVKDRSLGITLFGKRTDRTNQYFALDEIGFGTETFNKTIIGEALLKCADDLSTKLERSIPFLVSKTVVLSSSIIIDSTSNDSTIMLRRQLINGEIVILDGDDVFINLGSQDGISVGDLLPVFSGEKDITDPRTGVILGSRDEKIGEVQVIEIRAEHLCLATIISGKENIAAKQRVRKVLVR